MKIAAFSDSHGCLGDANPLPKIADGTDVVCIAGDIIPLSCQREHYASESWFHNVFFKWVKELNVSKVFLVSGNHDFYFQAKTYDEIINDIKSHGLEDKLIYLQDTSYEYENKIFYGSPWIINLRNWAFYTPNPREKFNKIPYTCDVLITHLPPKFGGVGCSYPNSKNEVDFGCVELKSAIEERDIKVNICGHIHTGIHNGVKMNNTMLYNVSLINEDYETAFEVTYFDI